MVFCRFLSVLDYHEPLHAFALCRGFLLCVLIVCLCDISFWWCFYLRSVRLPIRKREFLSRIDRIVALMRWHRSLLTSTCSRTWLWWQCGAILSVCIVIWRFTPCTRWCTCLWTMRMWSLLILFIVVDFCRFEYENERDFRIPVSDCP